MGPIHHRANIAKKDVSPAGGQRNSATHLCCPAPLCLGEMPLLLLVVVWCAGSASVYWLQSNYSLSSEKLCLFPKCFKGRRTGSFKRFPVLPFSCLVFLLFSHSHTLLLLTHSHTHTHTLITAHAAGGVPLARNACNDVRTWTAENFESDSGA